MNIISILERYRIHYITRGNNVAEGNVNVKCPFCGHADQSEHMGINLSTGAWGCWRRDTHRGGRLSRLLVQLLGIPIREAEKLVGDVPLVPTDYFATEMKRLLSSPVKVATEKENIEIPREFKPIHKGGASRYCWQYLCRRKFRETDVDNLVSTYKLRYASTGRWKHRIIIPITDEGGAVRGWIGRAIGRATHRYIFHPSGPQAKQYVFALQTLYGSSNTDVLLITEGPFDAMKVGFYGWMAGGVTCTFGTLPTNPQLEQLTELGALYRRTVICFDKGAESKAESLSEKLGHLNPRIVSPPKDYEDLGDLPPDDARNFITQLVPVRSRRPPTPE